MGRGIVVAILLLLATILAEADARPAWQPSEKHFNAQERAADCGVVRAIQKKNDTSLVEVKAELDRESTGLKTAHAELERCALNNQLPIDSDDEDKEAELASVCYTEYERWIARSYRVLMLEEEKGLAKSKGREVTRHLDSCPQPRLNEGPIKGAMVAPDLF